MIITIKGLEKFQKDLNTSLNQIQDIANKEYLNMIQDNIKRFSKTGELYKSFIIKNKDIFSSSDYANIQDIGGKIYITDKMRKKFWALFYKTNQSLYKALALTKQKYIIIKPKHYTDVNEQTLVNNIDKELNILFKKI